MNKVKIPKSIVTDIRKKGNFSFIVESQSILTEKSCNEKSHHLATIVIISGSGKKH